MDIYVLRSISYYSVVPTFATGRIIRKAEQRRSHMVTILGACQYQVQQMSELPLPSTYDTTTTRPNMYVSSLMPFFGGVTGWPGQLRPLLGLVRQPC